MIVTKPGGGTLVCCGQDMVLIDNDGTEQAEEETGEDEE